MNNKDINSNILNLVSQRLKSRNDMICYSKYSCQSCLNQPPNKEVKNNTFSDDRKL